MVGFWDLSDSDRYRTIKPKTHYAKRNSNGQWVAGPKAKGFQEGQFIPTREIEVSGTIREIPAGNVGRQWTLRRRNNLVKSIMRAQGEYDEDGNLIEALPEDEARDMANQMLAELDEAETDSERKKIWKKYAS